MIARENYLTGLADIVDYENEHGETATVNLGKMSLTAGANNSTYRNSPFYTMANNKLTME